MKAEGTDGKDGVDGKDGTDGKDGVDGRGVLKVEIINGCLWITYTDAPETAINVGKLTENAENEGIDELAYYLLPDGTYGVMAGTTKYLEKIVIPESYQGKAVTQILDNGFENAINLKAVTIPDSVTSISSNSFAGCTSLESITIPDSVTSISSNSFTGCTSLTSITIPDSVTSIGSNAFAGCTSLESVTFEENCQLTSVGQNAFSGCDILIEEEAGILYFEGLVIGCDRLVTNVTLRADTVGICYQAFHSCNSLTSITIPSSVTFIDERAFQSCNSLERVVFAENSKLTSIGYLAFWQCPIVNIAIPASVTSIGERAFDGSSHETITVQAGNPVYHSMGNCLIETESKTLILGCSNSEIPKDGSVTAIGYRAFSYQTIVGITIPDRVTSIEKQAFHQCDALISITIPESVKIIGESVFLNSGNLLSIVIPSSVTSIGDDMIVRGCTSLKAIYFDGTEIAWKNLGMDDSIFNGIEGAALYLYSETQPTEAGNYWRYVNGVPTVW